MQEDKHLIEVSNCWKLPPNYIANITFEYFKLKAETLYDISFNLKLHKYHCNV